MSSIIVLAIIGLIIYYGIKLRFKGTAYGPKNMFGGYSEIQLGPDTYEVKFQGNGNVRTEKSIDLCMLRCGELTLQNGYSFFYLLDGRSNSAKHTVTVNDTPVPTHPETTNTIKMFKEKPENDLGIYEASYVVNSFKKKYNLK